MHAHQHGTVHMTAAQVPRRDLLVSWRVCREQDRLDALRQQLSAAAPEDELEERLREDPGAVFAHHERDRSGMPPRRRVCCPVTHVAESRHHLFDHTPGLRPHPPGTGQYPRRLPLPYTTLLRDITQPGSCMRVRDRHSASSPGPTLQCWRMARKPPRARARRVRTDSGVSVNYAP